MVTFTCNKCGDSLKKQKVEVHRCKPFHLTCVDCLKDFGYDYIKHTGCISEKDRYSATGLNGVALKKTKQQRWLETVHDCCSRAIDDGTPGMNPGICDLFKYLLEVSNIPDKPKTFTNFVKNSRRSEPLKNIEFVWSLLDKARTDLAAKLNAEKAAAEAEAKKKKAEMMKNKKQDSSDSSSSDSDSDSEDDEKSKAPKNGVNEVASEVALSKSEKKKKRMMSESESVINGTSETRKAKKSKKNPKTDESEDSSNLNNALDACHLNGVVEEKLSKKEKKERKKREKYEAELKTLESVNATDETEPQDEPMEQVVEETETKKSKKKKKAEQKNLESVEDEPVEEVVEETESKKGKKKKNKKNAEEIAPLDEEPSDTKDKKKEKKSKKQQRQEEAERIHAEKPDKKGKTDKLENGKLNDTLKLDEDNGAEFSWDTAILQVLESQSDHEVSLKKLSKKVLNEYLCSVGDDAYVDEAKIINKFHKKLQKMHNVLVHKDKVRLKTSRD
ncbi:cell growth-regulating nucleolar protein [Thrips palmi]|uniref:Cell growth-regulating nucleolar protein n=1 Tax=Thrips palmi TaxID=161013 RepID=A0A6P8YC71_THRPL|nr:cell growth-regulating nucleolar protein [Thrips palmi]